MKKQQLTQRVNLSIRVLASAMHWYDRNIAQGCVRDNFTGQTRQLWDACRCLKERERMDKLK